MTIITKINTPNINNRPYIITPNVLNNKTYYFEYFWSIRDNCTYLSIYLLKDNVKTYILRSSRLVTGNIISKYIHNVEDWDGILSIWNYDETKVEQYNQQNFHTDYFLKFVIE